MFTKMKQTMNKLHISYTKSILLILLLVLSSTNFYSCKKENSPTKISKEIKNSDNYNEVSLSKKKIEENDKSVIYELKNEENGEFLLQLNLETENSTLKIHGLEISTDFNFTYDISEEDAINKIKFLTNSKGNFIFFLPVATEEFLTFQIIKYNKTDNKFFESNFHFDTHEENVNDIYLKSKAYLSETRNTYSLKIDSFTFDGKFQEKSFVKSELSKNNSINFDGNYNICIENLREDSINSETCYEIVSNSNSAIIDSNSSICKGNFRVKKIKENEITLTNESDEHCSFDIKKELEKYYFKSNISGDWKSIEKTQ